MILGNKVDKDLSGEREVDFLTASGFAQDNECLLFETSALTGQNVDTAIDKLVQTILNKMD